MCSKKDKTSAIRIHVTPVHSSGFCLLTIARRSNVALRWQSYFHTFCVVLDTQPNLWPKVSDAFFIWTANRVFLACLSDTYMKYIIKFDPVITCFVWIVGLPIEKYQIYPVLAALFNIQTPNISVVRCACDTLFCWCGNKFEQYQYERNKYELFSSDHFSVV